MLNNTVLQSRVGDNLGMQRMVQAPTIIGNQSQNIINSQIAPPKHQPHMVGGLEKSDLLNSFMIMVYKFFLKNIQRYNK